MPSNNFKHLKRKVGVLEENKSILIVCGGQETEPNYFNDFETYNCEVYVEKSRLGTKNLVQHTLQLKEKKNYDSVWCVFDKDDFKDFDEAIQFAIQNDVKVAYSNRCFELWVLMHFGKAPKLSQSQLINETNQVFKKELNTKNGYLKNVKNLYALLYTRQKTAISLAKKCYGERHLYGHMPSEQVGVTTVHLLVNELNENSPNRWD